MTKLFVAQDISTLKRYLSKEDDWLAIVDKCDHPDILNEWKVKIKTPMQIEKEMFEQSDDDETIQRKMIDWMKIWPNYIILEGKSLKQHLEYNGSSLWWMGESLIYRTPFGKYSTFKDIFIRIMALKYLISNNGITEVHLCGMTTKIMECTKLIAESNNIKCYLHSTNLKEKQPESFDPELVYRFKRIRSQIRTILSLINKYKFKDRSGDTGKILVVSYYMSIREDVYIQKEEQSYPTTLPKDMMLYSVLKSLLEKVGEPRVVYFDRRYPFGLDSIKKLKAPAFPNDCYNKIIDIKLYNERKKIKKLWTKLSSSKEFKNSLEFDGVKIWPLVKDTLSFMFIKQLPEAVELLHNVENLLAEERPEAVLISDETGFYGRALITSARSSQIKTIGLQHANLGLLDIEHTHQHEGDILPCPIPDVTAIGGENDMRILLQSGLYDRSNLAITGRPRYDNLTHMHDYYDVDALRKRYGIPDGKIVLLTTVRYPSNNDREFWLTAMVKASKKFEHTFFIVKPHPGEDVKMHKSIINRYGGKNILLVNRNADTKELLYACDIAINAGSAVGLEAILMGKPFVMVNVTGRADLTPYASKKAAIPVRDVSMITSELTKVLNRDFPSYLSTGTRKFIEDHAYKVDGKSSDRVVDLVVKQSGG